MANKKVFPQPPVRDRLRVDLSPDVAQFLDDLAREWGSNRRAVLESIVRGYREVVHSHIVEASKKRTPQG